MLVAALVAVRVASVQAQAVENTSYSSPSGERVLRYEATISAPLDSLWLAFTTSEGLRSFVARVVAIDFRIGGRWEASYNPAGRIGDSTNILNEIVAYLPREMFATRILSAPPSFPHADLAKRLATIYFFHEQSPRSTRVVVSMTGWEQGRIGMRSTDSSSAATPSR